MPARIQRQRTKGWRMPPGAVYVGRPTIWGNPFRHPDPAEAVAAYFRLIAGGRQTFSIEPGGLQIASDAHRNTLHHAFAEWVTLNILSLRGRDLACWCALDAPCHADVLLDLANRPRVVRGAGDLPTVLADLRPGPVTPEFC